MLLPHVTPHTLRRTFASLALTAGRDPRWVMGQLGHTDARFTLSVYAQAMQRQRIDYELVWSLMRFADERERWDFGGSRRSSERAFETTSETTGPKMPHSAQPADLPQNAETPADAGLRRMGAAGFEPATSRV